MWRLSNSCFAVEDRSTPRIERPLIQGVVLVLIVRALWLVAPLVLILTPVALADLALNHLGLDVIRIIECLSIHLQLANLQCCCSNAATATSSSTACRSDFLRINDDVEPEATAAIVEPLL